MSGCIVSASQAWIATESSQDRELQRQHDEIFGALCLVRERHDATGRARLTRAFDDFLDCTRAHFASEELLIGNFQPLRMPTHRAAHDAILRRTAELRRQFASMDPACFLLHLQLIEAWLSDHCIDEGSSLI